VSIIPPMSRSCISGSSSLSLKTVVFHLSLAWRMSNAFRFTRSMHCLQEMIADSLVMAWRPVSIAGYGGVAAIHLVNAMFLMAAFPQQSVKRSLAYTCARCLAGERLTSLHPLNFVVERCISQLPCQSSYKSVPETFLSSLHQPQGQVRLAPAVFEMSRARA
jgi:hypothetical protein